MIWKNAETDSDSVAGIQEALDVSPILSTLLVQRGLTTPDEAERFIRPRLMLLGDPFSVSGLEAAVERIDAALRRDERIVVFGDYDVDGVTSTVQMVNALRLFGGDPRYYVPRRMDEGYGLSPEAIERVCDDGRPDLFIALDCGTNAHEQVARLRSMGIDVLVVDHHQAKESPPTGCLFVNPQVNDGDGVAWRNLCTAGLVFKLFHGMMKKRRMDGDERAKAARLRENLDLVALGTLADLVPLEGENRILSWHGLRSLRAQKRPGLRALAEVSGLEVGHPLAGADVSFKLGPRINASGRLADATLPVEMLLESDYSRCLEIARELDVMNRDRQTIERAITEEAESMVVDAQSGRAGIVLFGRDWHPGVVGIVASRVSRKFHRPSIVLGAEGELAKGSGRSVDGIDLVAALQRCRDLLGHWGGHPMAVGIALEQSNLQAFAQAFDAAVRELAPADGGGGVLEITIWLDPQTLTESLLAELDHLHPFGEGNDEPVFGVRGVVLDQPVQRFGDGHFRFRLSVPGEPSVAGVAWRLEPPPAGQPVDLALRFAWNVWRDRRSPQLTLVAWRPSEG